MEGVQHCCLSHFLWALLLYSKARSAIWVGETLYGWWRKLWNQCVFNQRELFSFFQHHCMSAKGINQNVLCVCVCAYCCSTHVFKVLSDADCKINFQAESTTSRQKRNFKYQKCPKVCEVLARSKITHSSTPKPGLSYNICCVHLMVSWSDFGGILCRKVQKSSLVSRFGSWKKCFHIRCFFYLRCLSNLWVFFIHPLWFLTNITQPRAQRFGKHPPKN